MSDRPRLDVLIIYLILKVHDEYVRIEFDEGGILPLASVDDVSHFILQVNYPLPVFTALLTSVTLALRLRQLVFLVTQFGAASFLVLVTLTLKL